MFALCADCAADRLATLMLSLGGALVELTGALIALVFIRDDAMEQRKG